MPKVKEIKTKTPPEKRFPHHQYSPEDFDIGSKVRIYLAWATDTEVYIREGTVTNTRKEKYGLTLGLELLVEKSGKLWRDKPYDKCALNINGHTVWGTLHMKKVKKPYQAAYSYASITKAEEIK